MGTFTSKDIVDEIIARNGEHYPEEGPGFDVVKIVQYRTRLFSDGRSNWGVVYRCEAEELGMGDRYEHSENCLDPGVVFERKE